MKTAQFSLQKYFKEYIYNASYAILIIPSSILLVTLASYLEISCSNIQIEIKDEVGRGQRDSSILRLYIFKKVIQLLLNSMYSIFATIFVASSYQAAVKNFFLEYVCLKYLSFYKIGVGVLNLTIFRRSTALTEFLTALAISFISNMCFLLLVVEMIREELPFSSFIKIVSLLIIFFIISSYAQCKRANLRNKINHALELNSSISFDILINYERVKTYDNIDLEIKKYYGAMNNYVHHKRVYEITYETLGFINSASLVLLTYYILSEFNKYTFKSSSFMAFILISTKLKESVYDLSKDIDHILVSYSNLSHSNVDEEDYEYYKNGVAISILKDKIEVSKLKFSFDGFQILKNINFSIYKGSKIAITGPNGVGKSTLIKILMGFLPYEGSIKVDGIELNQINKDSLRNLISYIPQNPSLFNKTLIENLKDGNNKFSNEQIVEICKKYDYHCLFSNIGYNKSVGEAGKYLSGGQRQKICFMRAIIKDSLILVMDEPCSSLDKNSERKMIEQISSKSKGETVISIVNNPSILKYYDYIIFLDNGGIFEIGNFMDLVSKKGYFQAYYEGASTLY